MSYLNQIIRRQSPMTRCQCAILAVLTEEPAGIEEIWKRGAVYVDNKAGRIRAVAYGTISAILRGLVQQGFAERQGGKRPKYKAARR